MISSGTNVTTQFVLGMLHGLDVDHVLAVTGLASAAPDSTHAWRTTRIAFSWALGHGLVLLALAAPVLYFGMAVPEDFAWYVEAAIGTLLILLGFNVIRVAFRPAHFHGYSIHGYSILGAYHADTSIRAGLLGMLHGTAGWLALSALLPVAMHTEPTRGMMYLATFSVGVVVAILLAARLLARLLARWSQTGALRAWRLGLATATIAYGGYWIYVAR